MIDFLFGRMLEPAEDAIAVRVRDGQTLTQPGSLPGSERFLQGFDVIECADLDAAACGRPVHLLLGWIGPEMPTVLADSALINAIEAWRRNLDQAGQYVMGSSFGGVEAAATLRLREGRSLSGDSPFIEIAHEIASVDVIAAADRRAAVQRAETHPLAATHAVQVRPFAP